MCVWGGNFDNYTNLSVLILINILLIPVSRYSDLFSNCKRFSSTLLNHVILFLKSGFNFILTQKKNSVINIFINI